MRKILALTVSAFVLSLAACDSGSGSPTGSGGSGSLVGSWKSITSGSGSGIVFADTEFVTLSSGGTFFRRTATLDSFVGNPA